MKSALRKSRASGSTRRLVDKIVSQGSRSIRKRFVARDRAALRELNEGGLFES